MNYDEILQAGVAAVKAGDREKATQLFASLVQLEPQSEIGWLYLSHCLTTTEKRVYCYRRVLEINPNNTTARQKLAELVAKAGNEVAAPIATPSPQSGQPRPHKESNPVRQAAQTNAPVSPPLPKTTTQPEKHTHQKKKSNQNIWLIAGGATLLLLICGAIFIYLLAAARSAPTAANTRPTTLPQKREAPTATPTLIPTPTPRYVSAFEETACAFTIPSGVNVTCGFVLVPEDRDGDLSDQIQLAVAVFHATNRKKDIAPIIFLQGGPGSGSVEWSAKIYSILVEPLIQNRDFIFFDQRGTGLSQPSLDCPELTETYLKDLSHLLPGEQREEQYTNALLGCRNRLSESGANLSAYTTMESAADVKDILTALRYPKANLYGASYGTRLAQMVMREHPEIVQSAILDSILPLETKLYNEGASVTAYALEALFDGCAAQAECQAAYPDLEQIYTDLTQKLDKEPITLTTTFPIIGEKETTIDGMGLTSYLIWALREPEYIRLIPRALGNIQAGDFSFLEYAVSLPLSGVDGINMGVFISINCHEQVYATTPDEITADLAKYPNTEAFALSSIYGSGEALFNICALWQAKPKSESENTPLTSDIPTLIISGTYDPTTPPKFGEQVASRLSQHYLFEFPNGSHVPSISLDPCPVQVANAFLDDPTVKPNPTCWEKTQPIRFSAPYTGAPSLELTPYNDFKMRIKGVIPANWQAIGNGFFVPKNAPGEPTMIGHQTDPASIEEWLAWLDEQFNGKTGFDKTPVKTGTRKANNLTWSLYTTTSKNFPVDIAFARDGGQTILILMQSNPDERDAMYETVFLRLVDAATLLK